MTLIGRTIRLVGPLGEYETMALFDSGASVSCIRPDIAARLEQPISIRPPLTISTATEGSTVNVTARVTLDFYIGDYRFATDFYIVDNLAEEVIIGASTVQQWRFKLDFEREEVIIDPRVTRLRI